MWIFDGVIDVNESGMAIYVNGDVARYVTPGDAVLTSGQVVAVRIWIRVRAEEPEAGLHRPTRLQLCQRR